ncbi:MAG: hypothetical protein DHS20C16_29280 [Phycisphaerae bacterium]|nr:MAG: hypothetical protein DHS20C16_29280 [Phycisphaerae bacterium]
MNQSPTGGTPKRNDGHKPEHRDDRYHREQTKDCLGSSPKTVIEHLPKHETVQTESDDDEEADP